MFTRIKRCVACVLFLVVALHSSVPAMGQTVESFNAVVAERPNLSAMPVRTSEPIPDRPAEATPAFAFYRTAFRPTTPAGKDSHPPKLADFLLTIPAARQLPIEKRSEITTPPDFRNWIAAAVFPQEKPNPSATGSGTEPAKKSNLKKWLLIAAGGAAVGIIVAASQSGSDVDGSEQIITAGPPTVGAPQ